MPNIAKQEQTTRATSRWLDMALRGRTIACTVFLYSLFSVLEVNGLQPGDFAFVALGASEQSLRGFVPRPG